MGRKKMTEQEKLDWDSLYQYVKGIMNYDSDQALSNYMVLRLKGLSTNKFIENNNIKNTANYSFNTILNTFKFCSIDIQNALTTMEFKDETHKFNVILKIVEKKINDVHMRMKAAKKTKEDAKSIDMSHTVDYVNTFKSKEKKINSRLNELW